jgi:hypothetical protein
MKIATGDMGLVVRGSSLAGDRGNSCWRHFVQALVSANKKTAKKDKCCPSSHQGGVLGGEGGDFAARKGLGFACRFFGA